MKAVVFRKGKGLVYEDVPDYSVGPGEVLVQTANTGFCGSDHSLVAGGHLADGYILGHEISAVVVEKGAKADGPPVGTRVCIRPTYCGKCANCLAGRPHLCRVDRRTAGIGDLPGGFAQYVKVFPQMLIPIPKGVDSRNAALAETFASALHGIRCTSERTGSVLVMGGGPIGLCAVRLLRILGYGPIVLFEPVQAKRDIAIRYGADHALHPTDPEADARALAAAPGGFQKILECSGVKANINRAVLLAADGGEICVISMIFSPLTLEAPFLVNLKEIRLVASNSNTHEENIQCLNWMAEGKIDARPLISDYEPLHRLPAVYRERIDTGLAVKVLLNIGEEF
ncbi:MAG TPA: alcohol dehydrogenase catalytic domain-containing protein [Smithellaceae bacterium]|nr:alcohol dehydrogenase catalytic domain-containing protein [Smithellaceae bacterium]HRV44621.1 alcohol dehydrogenase catalytic domain-containing protein [Smithellaceae bacterium]